MKLMYECLDYTVAGCDEGKVLAPAKKYKTEISTLQMRDKRACADGKLNQKIPWEEKMFYERLCNVWVSSVLLYCATGSAATTCITVE